MKGAVSKAKSGNRDSDDGKASCSSFGNSRRVVPLDFVATSGHGFMTEGSRRCKFLQKQGCDKDVSRRWHFDFEHLDLVVWWGADNEGGPMELR